MKLTPRRVRLLRFAATFLLLGVFSFGAFSLVVERLATIDDALRGTAEVTENTADEFVPQGCDYVTDVAECPKPDPLDVSSLDGAIERYRNGVFASSDARFLVLSEEDYRILLEPAFGPAEVQEGNVVFDVPVWEASFGELDRAETFAWEQQWQLVGGAVMFEQLFVLGRTEDAEAFLVNHKAFMQGKGVKPVVHPTTGDGRVASLPLLFRFVDADAADPARRCVNRALAVLDRVVFAVSLMTGGNCATPSPALPAGVVVALRDRAEVIMGGR